MSSTITMKPITEHHRGEGLASYISDARATLMSVVPPGRHDMESVVDLHCHQFEVNIRDKALTTERLGAILENLNRSHLDGLTHLGDQENNNPLPVDRFAARLLTAITAEASDWLLAHPGTYERINHRLHASAGISNPLIPDADSSLHSTAFHVGELRARMGRTRFIEDRLSGDVNEGLVVLRDAGIGDIRNGLNAVHGLQFIILGLKVDDLEAAGIPLERIAAVHRCDGVFNELMFNELMFAMDMLVEYPDAPAEWVIALSGAGP